MFKRFWWIFPVMLVVGPFVGFALAVLLTRMTPEQYESESVIEVKPSVMMGKSSSDSPAHSSEPTEDPAASIKSPEILALTSRHLNLPGRWDMEKNETLSVLTRIVHVGRIRGTDLWSIRVRHPDNVVAKEIALEVPRAYREHMSQIQFQQAEGMIRTINEEVRKQEDVVESIRKRLMAAAAESPNESGLAEKTYTTTIHADVKNEFVAAQDVLQNLKLKQMGETVSRKIPGESVFLHVPAVISNRPVPTDETLILVLGTVAGFLFSPLMALPMIRLFGRRMPDPE
jgi:uncharacterized protein involved in exopolysaccharide biosynthesis